MSTRERQTENMEKLEGKPGRHIEIHNYIEKPITISI